MLNTSDGAASPFWRRSWRCLLLLPMLGSVAGCSTVSPAPMERHCPKPTRAEAEDVIELGDRPAARWIGRVMAYCWPEVRDP